MPIDFVNLVIGGILNLNGPMREHSNYYKKTGPPRSKLPREEMKTGVIQELIFPRTEVLPLDLTIMKNFGSLYSNEHSNMPPVLSLQAHSDSTSSPHEQHSNHN